MKRFYKMVSAGEIPGGHGVFLDGKPVRTPARHALVAPNIAIANEVTREWMAQGDVIKPDSMPITQILSTKIDHIAVERAAITASILKYLDTDLVCYRSVEPPEMAQAQAAAWDPWLSWFKERFGAALLTTTELAALKQPSSAHTDVALHVEALDDDRFTVLQMTTAAGGSLVLALAFAEGAIDAQTLFAATRVEELYKARRYNEEKYGPDPAQEKKDAAFIADLNAAGRFIALLR